MGVPAKLTERQIKFAELLVYNEGRLSPAEAAFQAGYKTRPRQAASELRNPKISPLVVKYIGELRAEVQEKYGISVDRITGHSDIAPGRKTDPGPHFDWGKYKFMIRSTIDELK